MLLLPGLLLPEPLTPQQDTVDRFPLADSKTLWQIWLWSHWVTFFWVLCAMLSVCASKSLLTGPVEVL